MRISDWSSDVCSSDLNISRKMFHNVAQGHCTGHRGSLGHPAGGVQHSAKSVARCCTGGRRSCRHPHKTERNPTRFPPACRATLREKCCTMLHRVAPPVSAPHKTERNPLRFSPARRATFREKCCPMLHGAAAPPETLSQSQWAILAGARRQPGFGALREAVRGTDNHRPKNGSAPRGDRVGTYGEISGAATTVKKK